MQVPRWLDGLAEGGYVSVAAYGCSLSEGGAFGASVTRRVLPSLLGAQVPLHVI